MKHLLAFGNVFFLVAIIAVPSKAQDEQRVARWVSSSSFSTAQMATQPEEFTLLSTSSFFLADQAAAAVISFWRDDTNGKMIRCHDFHHIVGEEPTAGRCFVAYK
jgi:hypothetical protein